MGAVNDNVAIDSSSTSHATTTERSPWKPIPDLNDYPSVCRGVGGSVPRQLHNLFRVSLDELRREPRPVPGFIVCLLFIVWLGTCAHDCGLKFSNHFLIVKIAPCFLVLIDSP